MERPMDKPELPYDAFVSDEPLDIIMLNECEGGDISRLASMRFRRLANEIHELRVAIKRQREAIESVTGKNAELHKQNQELLKRKYGMGEGAQVLVRYSEQMHAWEIRMAQIPQRGDIKEVGAVTPDREVDIMLEQMPKAFRGMAEDCVTTMAGNAYPLKSWRILRAMLGI